MTTKYCYVCKIDKPLSEFHNSKQGKLGKNSNCIACAKAKHDVKYNIKRDEWIKKANEKAKDLEGEIWKEVEGFKGEYEVSNFGRVKSLPKNRVMFGYLKLMPIRIMSLKSKDTCGYLQVSLTKMSGNKKRTMKLIHRLVAQAFIPNPLNKLEVNHIDTNKLNNNVTNLEWLTRDEHVIHTNKNISFNRVIGNTHWKSKVNEKIVIEMREKYKSGNYVSFAQLGREYGLNRHHTADIIHRKHWKHI